MWSDSQTRYEQAGLQFYYETEPQQKYWLTETSMSMYFYNSSDYTIEPAHKIFFTSLIVSR